MNKQEHSKKIQALPSDWFNERRSRFLAETSYNEGYQEAIADVCTYLCNLPIEGLEISKLSETMLKKL